MSPERSRDRLSAPGSSCGSGLRLWGIRPRWSPFQAGSHIPRLNDCRRRFPVVNLIKMSTKPDSYRSMSLAVCVAAAWVPAHAGGFRLPDQDAFATARGEAFAATADNPSAVY